MIPFFVLLHFHGAECPTRIRADLIRSFRRPFKREIADKRGVRLIVEFTDCEGHHFITNMSDVELENVLLERQCELI